MKKENVTSSIAALTLLSMLSLPASAGVDKSAQKALDSVKKSGIIQETVLKDSTWTELTDT